MSLIVSLKIIKFNVSCVSDDRFVSTRFKQVLPGFEQAFKSWTRECSEALPGWMGGGLLAPCSLKYKFEVFHNSFKCYPQSPAPAPTVNPYFLLSP